jgi:RND family efflux transporter MFP subunit
VASPEFGLIESLLCQVDSRVARDQVLARLDCRHLEASLRVAEAKAQATARAQALAVEKELRAQRLTRLEELLSKGRASQEEVDRARADADIAVANWAAAREDQNVAQLECAQIREQIARRSIRCPLDGYVVHLEHEAGECLVAHEPVVATVAQLDPLRIHVYVPPRVAAVSRPRDRAAVTFPATGQTAHAKIDRISPICEPETGTIRIQLLLENPDNQYQSGLACRVLFPDADGHARKSPSSATRDRSATR